MVTTNADMSHMVQCAIREYFGINVRIGTGSRIFLSEIKVDTF